MKNYYDTLGVAADASDEAIKDAYRKLAKKFHPDINGGDIFFKHHFQKIQEAYEILSDPVRRRQYQTKDRAASSQMGSQNIANDLEKKIFAYQKQNEQFRRYQQAHVQQMGLKTSTIEFINLNTVIYIVSGIFVFLCLLLTFVLLSNTQASGDKLTSLFIKTIVEGSATGLVFAILGVAFLYYYRKK